MHAFSGNRSSFWNSRPSLGNGSDINTDATIMLYPEFKVSVSDFYASQYSTNARLRISVFLSTTRASGNVGKKSIRQLVSFLCG